MPEELAKIHRRVQNWAKKYHRRKHILESYARSHPNQQMDKINELEVQDEVESIKDRISVADWKLLVKLAAGSDYQTLSDELGLPVGTIKAKVSRVRTEVREYNSGW